MGRRRTALPRPYGVTGSSSQHRGLPRVVAEPHVKGAGQEMSTTYVGMDAHKATIRVAMLLPGAGEPQEWQLRDALRQAGERHLQFEAGERCAEAEVDTMGECQVVTGLAVDVELVGAGELRLVPVPRHDGYQHAFACPDELPANLHVLECNAPCGLADVDDREVAKELLHDLRRQRRVSAQACELEEAAVGRAERAGLLGRCRSWGKRSREFSKSAT